MGAASFFLRLKEKDIVHSGRMYPDDTRAVILILKLKFMQYI
jgi:hypothetical protein